MSSTATTEAPKRLTSHSRHTSSPWVMPVNEVTANAWINDAVKTTEKATARPPQSIELLLYRLVKDEDGEYECRVVGTRTKPIAFEVTTTTKFTGKVAADASLLDGYFSGEGPGAELRDTDAAKLLALWATTVQPTPEAARNAGKALSIRAAIRRGSLLDGHEAVV
jgi:hypothetical protein